MSQIRIAVLIAGREILIGDLLQASAILGRHHVPRFGRTEVQIVDRIQVHVLSVPGECRFPHAKVQVGSVDAINLYIIVLVDKVQYAAQAIYVPALWEIVEA